MSASYAARRAVQQSQVRSLYRKSLKLALSWAVHREAFYREATKARAKFEANKFESDPHRIDRLIATGKAQLDAVSHPDPYIVPWFLNGSKWARNPPVPDSIHNVYGFGKEEK
eukprot:TRINITY_DN7148_c0_g1_i1.p1 TRINITY_DN7148_c0_g1~~TRINITY_DN7148_c0_g1_i1.p1  ORF type:complete len:113 (+),score=14.03 TRINITY_DN7148_c0_g1_i1:69-407(+)